MILAVCASHIRSARRLGYLSSMVASWSQQLCSVPLHIIISADPSMEADVKLQCRKMTRQFRDLHVYFQEVRPRQSASDVTWRMVHMARGTIMQYVLSHMAVTYNCLSLVCLFHLQPAFMRAHLSLVWLVTIVHKFTHCYGIPYQPVQVVQAHSCCIPYNVYRTTSTVYMHTTCPDSMHTHNTLTCAPHRHHMHRPCTRPIHTGEEDPGPALQGTV